MKFSKKITMISVAALMAIAPVASVVRPVNAASVQASQAQTLTGRVRVYLKKNAYAYNRRGYRTGRKYIKNRSVIRFNGTLKKISSIGKKQFYYENNGTNYWLPTKKIKGHSYTYIGSGQYIRTANIGTMDFNKDGFTESQETVYVGQSYQKTIPLRDIDGKTTGNTVKPGQKIVIDQQIRISGVTPMDEYYRIKGTNEYIYVNDLKSGYPYGYLKFYSKTFTGATNKRASLYDANGNIFTTGVNADPISKYGALGNMTEAIYLWVPSENKAELFYFMPYAWLIDGNINSKDLVNAKYVQSDFHRNGYYIKAADVRQDGGPTPKVVNTEADAKADRRVATNADKASLRSAIASGETALKNFKFTSGNSSRGWNLGGSLQMAKEVNESSKSTVVEVKQAVWSLQDAMDKAK